MKTYWKTIPVALGMAFAIISCSDDDASTASTTELSSAEQTQIQSAVSQALADIQTQTGVSFGVSKTANHGGRAESLSVSGEYTCALGGKISWDGTYSLESATNNHYAGSYTFNIGFDGCKFEYEDSNSETQDGELTSGTLVYTGEYDFTYDLSSQSSASITGHFTSSEKGSFVVSGVSGGDGTCGVNIETNVNYDTDPITYTRTGNFCGKEVEQENG